MKKKVAVLLFMILVVLSFGEEEEKLVKIPLIFSSPDTGFGGGVMGIGYGENKDYEKPNSYNFGGIITQQGQYLIFGGFESFLKGGKYKREIGVNFSSWPSSYYGIGQNSLLENKDDYDMTKGGVSIKYSKRFSKNFVAGPVVEFSYYDLGSLNKERTSNSVVKNGNSKEAGLGLKLEYDSRDRNFDPRKGIFSELSFTQYGKYFSGDSNYNTTMFDFRKYNEIFKNTLAFQFNLISETGDIPFYNLAGYGGSNIMRGYNEGRYIDKNTVATQLEYRFKISKKYRGVVFGGVGEVFSQYKDFDSDKIKTAYGAGIRYIIDKEAGINFRLDFAINDGDEEDKLGIYFSVMEAF